MIDLILKRAIKLGAEQAEVFICNAKKNKVSVRNFAVEEVKSTSEIGFAVRIINKKAMGFSFSTMFDKDSITETIKQAIETSEITAKDKDLNFFADSEKVCNNNLEIYDKSIDSLSLEDRINFALAIEKEARKNKKISKTELISYSDSFYEVALKNSFGIDKSYIATSFGGACEVIADGKNSSEAGFSIDYKTSLKDFDPKFIGEQAATSASQMLDSGQIDTANLEIVLPPITAVDFLSVLAPMFFAENIFKQKSLLASKLEKKIASPKINIIDNGILKKGLGSAPFDAEGVNSSKTNLVEKGILKNYLSDLYYAKKLKIKTTANATRSSHQSLPMIDNNNFYIEAGSISEKDLIKSIKKGFYVTRLMGLHTANPISGDFSLGASGLLIENGKLTKPIRGVAIAGNLLDVLLNITELANNLKFILNIGSPTLNLGTLTVSGK